MSDYSWPADGPEAGARAQAAWAATRQALPIGTPMTGEIVGRQRFGVGLAEIITMPRDAVLPQVGARVRGEVIGHADHNCQVRIKLDA
jgi:hypothetical protein